MNFKPYISFACFLLISLPSSYFFTKLTSAFVPMKENKKLFIPILIALACINNVVIFNQDIVNITWAFIGYFIILWLAFEGSLFQRLSTALILYPFVACFNYLLDSFSLLDFLLGSFYSEYAYNIMHAGLITLFWYIMCSLFYKKINYARYYLNLKAWLLLSAISISPLIGISYIIITVPSSEQLITLPILLIILLTNIGVLYLTSYMAQYSKTLLENESLQREKDYYNNVAKNQEEIRKLRHDLNNHLSLINTLLENNQIEEAKTYFTKLTSFASGINRKFCSNTLLNALLCTKYNLALENNIDTFFHIELNDDLPLPDLDLCSLFGNSLDNAIEACLNISQSETRKLSLKVRCKNGFLSYQLSNSSNHKAIYHNGKFLSTKKEPLHGLGLSKITDIVKKYNGTQSIEQTGNEFILTIIFPL